jgi:hypothetical protein
MNLIVGFKKNVSELVLCITKGTGKWRRRAGNVKTGRKLNIHIGAG